MLSCDEKRHVFDCKLLRYVISQPISGGILLAYLHSMFFKIVN